MAYNKPPSDASAIDGLHLIYLPFEMANLASLDLDVH